MGFMDSVGKVLGGVNDFLDSNIGGVLSSLGGASMEYDAARRLQHDAQDWYSDLYGRRHQMEVADLRAAGLNPVLSAKFGGAGISGTGIASSPISNPAVVSAQVAKTRAETELIRKQKDIVAVEATQKGRELEHVDDFSEFSKKATALINSMPAWLRGPLRFGIGSSSYLYEVLKDSYGNRAKDSGSGSPVSADKPWPEVDWSKSRFKYRGQARYSRKGSDAAVAKDVYGVVRSDKSMKQKAESLFEITGQYLRSWGIGRNTGRDLIINPKTGKPRRVFNRKGEFVGYRRRNGVFVPK